MLAFSMCVSVELLDMIVNISQIEYRLTVEYNIRHPLYLKIEPLQHLK